MWAWGSNYNCYVEVHLTDHRGISHVIPLGNLNYTGWKELKVEIPSHIAKHQVKFPKTGQLSLSKIVVWTRPEEKAGNFFIYFDNIKVLTDMYISRFDGDDLADPEKINNMDWTGPESEDGGNE